MTRIGAAALLLSVPAATVGAQGSDILAKALNQPGANYTVLGTGQTSRWVRDAKVPGGQALRIEVASKGPESYSVQAVSPIAKPVAKGHRITVAIWARAPKAKSGETLPIAFFGLIGGAPSFTPIATGKADIGPDWKLYDASGTAPADFAAPGGASVAVHLAAAKGSYELGPVFVIDRDAP